MEIIFGELMVLTYFLFTDYYTKAYIFTYKYKQFYAHHKTD